MTKSMQEGDTFVEVNLGITGKNEKIKFRTEFTAASQIKIIEVAVYGWGLNTTGNDAKFLNRIRNTKIRESQR